MLTQPLKLLKWNIAFRIAFAKWFFVSSIGFALRIENNESQFLPGIIELKIIVWNELVALGIMPYGSDSIFINGTTTFMVS